MISNCLHGNLLTCQLGASSKEPLIKAALQLGAWQLQA